MYKVRHIARELAANLAMSIPAVRDLRVRSGRTVGHPIHLKAQSVLAQFNFFLDTIGPESIQNRTVVEIGPGDAIPLAPLFIGAGAKKYVAVDRFLGDVTSSEAVNLYQAVWSRAPDSIRERLIALGLHASDRCWRDFIKADARVRLIKTGIEHSAPDEAQGADYLVSFNVCEHVEDLPAALRNMAALLGPDGRMIHRVDYGPHDVWQGYENPLAFLTVPKAWWKMMSGKRGCPNRVRHRELLTMARSIGLSVVDRVGQRAAAAYVKAVRPHLSGEFRSLSDADVSVLDAEVVLGFAGDLRLGRAYHDDLTGP